MKTGSGNTILSVILIVLIIVGLATQKGIRQKYEGVFGIPKALLFFISSFYSVYNIIALFSPEIYGASYHGLPTIIISTLISITVCVLIAVHTRINCPDDIKGGLFISMLLAGWGLMWKGILCVFVILIPLIWSSSRQGFDSQFGDYDDYDD